ncbi:MAG TPA: type II toxin-antitoxin system ParD family antitoxin [Rhizomicrobium sp.]
MPRSSKPLTVTLGDLHGSVAARLKAGTYASASEVLRAAVRALDREEAAIGEWLRRQIDESLNDPRPNIPAQDVFARLHKHHERKAKGKREAV